MLTPDTLLQNRYLVQKQIGKGGMGVVYLATDQRFGSTVALKETLIDKPQFLKAFEREARLLNHLKHPALPRVSDHFTEGDGQFLVMEYVPGPDLGETLKARGIPFTRASVLEWADQLLDALDYLHTQKPPVVHRDIKPQNLKLNSRGDVMLLDFGLAKGTPLHGSDASMTASLFGYSFHYAPLEQMQGTGTDPRSDLYSLAATLYHLLTGVTPPDALTRATAVLNGEPDPLKPAHKIQAQVTAPVAAVLANAMALRPAERPQTAAEMRAALHEAGHRVSAVSIPVVASQLPEAQPFRQGKLVDTGSVMPSAIASDTGQHSRSRSADSYNARTVVSPNEAGLDRSSASPHSRNDSFTTRVRVYQSSEPPPPSSNRTATILIGVLVLAALAAAVVYALTRSSTVQPTTVQTVQSPAETAPLPSTFNDSQSRPATSQSFNEPAVPVSHSGQKAGGSSQSLPVEVGSNPQQPAAADTNTAAQPKPQDTSASPASSALTREEERAREAEEARQRIRDRDEEERRRREADERARMEMERQRDMQRREPPPGMGPPPPRRGGPPPF